MCSISNVQLIHADRLKITLASGFALSRLAFSCLYHADVYSQHNYKGRNMMYWCKREVRWGAEYLLKTHVTKGGAGSKETFDGDDKFVIMVRSCLWSHWYNMC